MSTNFDERIRSVLADARSQAPAPVGWSDVVERPIAPAPTARPRFGRVLVAAAAGLVMVLVAGLAVIAQRDSDVDAPSLTAAQSLSQIEPGEAALPTDVPEGWSIEPLINDGQLSWNFVDPATGRTGGVGVGGPLEAAPSQAVVDVAGIEWEVLESVSSYRNGFELGSVVVYAPGFGFGEIEPLLAGLRPGPPADHPGGVFDPRSDGDVIVSADDGTLRAAVVNERVCWAFFELDEIRTTGCSLDPLATPAPSEVSLDDGIAILMQFGIGTSIENERNDTVIGVTTTDIAEVELEFTDGETITAPTSDPTGALGVRFFVADKLTVQTDESMSLLAVKVAGLDDDLTNPVEQSAATDSTVEATTPPPIEEPLEVERIAILDPAAGFGPAETLSEVDLWLGAGTGDDRHYAIRRTETDDPVVLNWSLLADSEWSKTYFDQPDVELPDGRVAKRLIPTLVDVVKYAIQTDDGVFSAAITPVAEAELAQWLGDVAGTGIDTITPPDGYKLVAAETGTRVAIYDDQTTLYTTTFDDSIEFVDYIETRFTGFSLEPIGDQGAFVATASDDNVGLQNNTVIWQPQPDVIVTAGGPPEELSRLADALTLTDLAAANLSIRHGILDPNITDEPDLTVLDETSEGRFAYTQTTQPDGTICYSFFHAAHGGGGRCQEDPTTSPVADCGSGWSSPDEASASVFVLSDVVPDIEFSVDGRALDPNIETGTTNGVPWVFAWVRENGRANEDPPIEIAVDQSRC